MAIERARPRAKPTTSYPSTRCATTDLSCLATGDAPFAVSTPLVPGAVSPRRRSQPLLPREGLHPFYGQAAANHVRDPRAAESADRGTGAVAVQASGQPYDMSEWLDEPA